ncbi:MAG: FkbM family methyltransferase, partial [Candidatus Saccharibacteria bacterium]|nr:FkbM family methyltransferase [Pseudorhodobacter sp.]
MTAAPFDTILHIGCGTGEATPGWLTAGAARVVLVEPNPAHAASLSRLSARYNQVEVIEAAIAAQDGEALLRVFNLARHSSLSGAAGLTDLLPGLRQVALVPVATLSPASLLARLGPLPGTTLLILDAPGAGLAILQGLQGASGLDAMTSIELVCTEQPQYQGATGRADLQAWLESAGFALNGTDLSDPDWPRLTFRVDQRSRQIADLTAQMQTRDAAAQTLTALHEAKVAALHVDLTAAHDTIAALTRQVQDETTALTARQAQEVTDLNAVIADLRQQLATARQAAEPPADSPALTQAVQSIAQHDE